MVATNTSSISITRLAASTDRPERFIGIHFMNPVPVMQLVELIRGIATEDPTFESAKASSPSSARRSRSRRISRPSSSTASCCR
jgi:3-hydroxyacyl-CoA dehydrogenase